MAASNADKIQLRSQVSAAFEMHDNMETGQHFDIILL